MDAPADPSPRWPLRLQSWVAGLPPTAKAVCLSVFATLMFQSMNAVIRHTASTGIHPFEVAFFRNLFGLAVLTPLLARYGLKVLYTSRFRLHLLRGVVNVTSMMCFFYAVSVTPLANVASLGFTLPLFVTVYAAVLLKERLRSRRLTALAFGVAGALMIVRPGSDDMNVGTLIVLGGTAVWGMALMIIKVQGRTDSPLTITLWSSIMLTLLSALPAVYVWQTPDHGQLLWLALTGLLGTTGTLAIAQALRMAEASAIMPFDFAKFIWAALLGHLAFGEVPSPWVWAGGTVIFSSTVYLTFREARLARAGRLQRAGPTLPA
ncbi:MAG: EamA family transporter [Alphaproteobacteria bacterium]|nr:EamA family transporter [Alphaproteobacteria bacterium]